MENDLPDVPTSIDADCVSSAAIECEWDDSRAKTCEVHFYSQSGEFIETKVITIETQWVVYDLVQACFPRSKKRRIRNKWAKDMRNFALVEMGREA